jgi:hypothetical protein
MRGQFVLIAVARLAGALINVAVALACADASCAISLRAPRCVCASPVRGFGEIGHGLSYGRERLPRRPCL